jgi:hypothetical protein
MAYTKTVQYSVHYFNIFKIEVRVASGDTTQHGGSAVEWQRQGCLLRHQEWVYAFK